MITAWFQMLSSCYVRRSRSGHRPTIPIGDGNGDWSEWYQLRGQPQKAGESFTFLYISDVQVGIHDHYPRVIRPGSEHVARFFICDVYGRYPRVGLQSGSGTSFFRANGWIFGMRPVVACPTAHEYTRESSPVTGTTCSVIRKYSPQPAEQGNYWYDYQ